MSIHCAHGVRGNTMGGYAGRVGLQMWPTVRGAEGRDRGM
jgi:hypothetical protein